MSNNAAVPYGIKGLTSTVRNHWRSRAIRRVATGGRLSRPVGKSKNVSRSREPRNVGETVAHKKTCEIRFEFTPDNFRTPPELFARLIVNNVLRILISAICIPIAAFCVFGFLASFEPGVGSGWKIGYAIVFATCIATSIAPWLMLSNR